MSLLLAASSGLPGNFFGGQFFGGQFFGDIPPPTPPAVGGGASAGRRGRLRGEGWARERELLERSLQQIEEQGLRQIARTLADSDRPQAQRIARKLVDYNGELEQIQSLRRELAKLEVAQQERTAANLARQQYDADMQAAAAELRAVLRDDDDAIAVINAAEVMDIQHVMDILGMTIH